MEKPNDHPLRRMMFQPPYISVRVEDNERLGDFTTDDS